MMCRNHNMFDACGDFNLHISFVQQSLSMRYCSRLYIDS